MVFTFDGITGRRGAGKAIIATARKLLAIVYDTLKSGWMFANFTTFSRKENLAPAEPSS